MSENPSDFEVATAGIAGKQARGKLAMAREKTSKRCCRCCVGSSSYLSRFGLLTDCRLEKALEQPGQLSQETIVENLDSKEAARLDKVRNIGIAVCHGFLL